MQRAQATREREKNLALSTSRCVGHDDTACVNNRMIISALGADDVEDRSRGELFSIQNTSVSYLS
jgi:hypothetical protein